MVPKQNPPQTAQEACKDGNTSQTQLEGDYSDTTRNREDVAERMPCAPNRCRVVPKQNPPQTAQEACKDGNTSQTQLEGDYSDTTGNQEDVTKEQERDNV